MQKISKVWNNAKYYVNNDTYDFLTESDYNFDQLDFTSFKFLNPLF